MSDELYRFHSRSQLGAVDAVVTHDHVMYAQMPRDSRKWRRRWKGSKAAVVPPVRIAAERLYAARGLQQQQQRGVWSHCRFLSLAVNGAIGPGELLSGWPPRDAGRPGLTLKDDEAKQLQLTTQDELDAFIELYGHWLGAGSLDSATRSVRFSPSCHQGCGCLLALFHRLEAVLPLCTCPARLQGGRLQRLHDRIEAAPATCCVYVEAVEAVDGATTAARCRFHIRSSSWWRWFSSHYAAPQLNQQRARWIAGLVAAQAGDNNTAPQPRPDQDAAAAVASGMQPTPGSGDTVVCAVLGCQQSPLPCKGCRQLDGCRQNRGHGQRSCSTGANLSCVRGRGDAARVRSVHSKDAVVEEDGLQRTAARVAGDDDAAANAQMSQPQVNELLEAQDAEAVDSAKWSAAAPCACATRCCPPSDRCCLAAAVLLCASVVDHRVAIGWWTKLHARQWRLLLRGLRHADGDQTLAAPHGRCSAPLIRTSSTRFRDEIQRAALNAGFACWFVPQRLLAVLTGYRRRCGRITLPPKLPPSDEELARGEYQAIVASVAGWAVCYSDDGHCVVCGLQTDEMLRCGACSDQYHGDGRCRPATAGLGARFRCPHCAAAGLQTHRSSAARRQSEAARPIVSGAQVHTAFASERVWCVSVSTGLIICRRVTERDPATGAVWRASKPIIVGNCKSDKAEEEDGGVADGLSLRDVRQVYRHLLQFGDSERVVTELFASAWRHRPHDESARLQVRAAIDRIVAACEEAVHNPRPEPPSAAHPASVAEDEEDEGGEQHEGRKRKAKKKLSVELLPGLMLHPVELLQRRLELQLLSAMIAAHSDPLKFRLSGPRPAPAVRWTRCIWKARQDAMLLYGVHLHGMNAWDAIVDDPRLHLKDCIVVRRPRAADAAPADTSAAPAASPSSTAQHAATAVPSAPPASSPSAAATAAAGGGVPEMEEIRTVKNGQLAARAALLLRLIRQHNASAGGGARSGLQPDKKARPDRRADDGGSSNRKRGRTEPVLDADDGDAADRPSRERRAALAHSKRPRSDDADNDADVDMAAAPTASAGAAAAGSPSTATRAAAADAGSSSRSSRKRDISGARGDVEGDRPQQRSGRAPRAEDGNRRIDDMFRHIERSDDERGRTQPHQQQYQPPALQHKQQPTKPHSSAAASIASSPPTSHRAAPASSRQPPARRSNGGVGQSSQQQRQQQPAGRLAAKTAATSTASGTSRDAVAGGGGSGSSEDEWLPSLLSWCKAALQSVNGPLKDLYRFAHDAGGFKAHQTDVRPRLLIIGREVERLVRAEQRQDRDVKAELERHLWHYVSLFSRMNGRKLRKLYSLCSRDQAAQATASSTTQHR